MHRVGAATRLVKCKHQRILTHEPSVAPKANSMHLRCSGDHDRFRSGIRRLPLHLRKAAKDNATKRWARAALLNHMKMPVGDKKRNPAFILASSIPYRDPVPTTIVSGCRYRNDRTSLRNSLASLRSRSARSKSF